MNPVRHIAGLDRAAELPARPVHLAIGMFDGVHLGHRAVLEAAVISARRAGGIAVALTFDPHPSRLFRPAEPVLRLLPPQLNADRMLETGIEFVVTQPFTREFAAIAAEKFLSTLKATLPRLVAVYVGENWRYGRGRQGDVASLVRDGRIADIKVFSAPRVNFDGRPISSTRIRDLLQRGDIEGANALLGYAYAVQGTVEPGQQLGRKIGVPTLNLPWSPECEPRRGVYAVRLGSADTACTHTGVANYGVRPTVAEQTSPVLEIHVLEADCPWDAGSAIRVEWGAFLRPEKRFDSVDELQRQIQYDIVAARALAAGNS